MVFNKMSCLTKLSVFILLYLLCSQSLAVISTKVLFEADKSSDYLGMRVLIKKIFKEGLDANEWHSIRQTLQKRAQVGYDLIYKWDRVTTRDMKLDPQGKSLNDLLDQADGLMDTEKFEAAFGLYQKVAKALKSEILKGQKDNVAVYTSTIHSMARALYGAGRFKQALEVYGWIDRKYPKYRRVLFEKMWTAFRMGAPDIALGAIASQESSYFSEFLDPESYLVQIYLYKILCRENEIKKARDVLIDFKRRLHPQTGNLDYQVWAQSDIETLSLLQLAKAPIIENTYGGLVTVAEKRAEQNLIRKALESRFVSERARMYQYIDKVIAYSYLAAGADRRVFRVEKLPDRGRLLKVGKEIWPVDDAEDWVDEIGGHLYIGESLCPAQ